MKGNINILPFTDINHLGDLVDVVFPTTSVYNTSNGNPLIVEWADVEDSEGDIYYLYQTTPFHLKLYLQRRLSHYELIHSAVLGISYVFKGDVNSAKNITMASVQNLPESYFPDTDVYFESDEAFDVDIIEKTFDLDNLNAEDYQDQRLYESLNLHFREGKHIGFGEGDVKVVGEVLANLGGLYEEIVIDKHKGVERIAKLNKQQRQHFDNEKPLNIVGLRASSLSIIVKPKAHIERITFDEEMMVTTDADDTFGRISSLLQNSLQIEKIMEVKDSYNTKVFAKLEKLAESIQSNELCIDFKYKSIQTSEYYDITMNPNSSQTVIANIKRIYEDSSAPEEHDGTFDMIHCGTGHFSFKSSTEKFRGYFQKGLMDLTSLDFKTHYNIKINRTTKKGKQDGIRIINIEEIEEE